MMAQVQTRFLLSALLVAGIGAGAAAAQTGAGVYVPASQISALVTKTTDGVATAPVPTGPGTTLLAARRTADGLVEVHTKLNDEFVVQAGHATVLVGG